MYRYPYPYGFDLKYIQSNIEYYLKSHDLYHKI